MIHSPVVLYFIADSRKEKQITKLCRKLGIRLKGLKPEDSNTEIGALAGITRTDAGSAPVRSHASAPVGYVLPELLIFSGLSDESLDVFLAEYKKAGIEPVGLKAIVTPHNLTWTVYELTAELVRERTAMLLGGTGKR